MDIGGFGVSIWPILTSLQRDRDRSWYGSAQFQVRDRAHAVNGVYAIKVYSTLVHVVKVLGTANVNQATKQRYCSITSSLSDGSAVASFSDERLYERCVKS